MWRRAVKVSIIVGTILNLINNGAVLFGEAAPGAWWKVPLTYLVPFAVSVYSSHAERATPLVPGASPRESEDHG